MYLFVILNLVMTAPYTPDTHSITDKVCKFDPYMDRYMFMTGFHTLSMLFRLNCTKSEIIIFL
jgi:hypothetical protein